MFRIIPLDLFWIFEAAFDRNIVLCAGRNYARPDVVIKLTFAVTTTPNESERVRWLCDQDASATKALLVLASQFTIVYDVPGGEAAQCGPTSGPLDENSMISTYYFPPHVHPGKRLILDQCFFLCRFKTCGYSRCKLFSSI